MTTAVETVEVERFDVNAESQRAAGRPLVVEFRKPHRRGKLSVRVDRSGGALHIFGVGPSGGDRGHITIGLKRAHEVIAFLNAGEGDRQVLGSSNCYLSIRRPYRDRQEDMATKDRLVSLWKGSSINAFTLRFGPSALDELRTCLREWAATALVTTTDPPTIGEDFGRGPMPSGKREQVRAWLQAGPEGRLVRITGAPGDDARGVKPGHVRYAHVARANGALGGETEVPLATFYGDGWRRIG